MFRGETVRQYLLLAALYVAFVGTAVISQLNLFCHVIDDAWIRSCHQVQAVGKSN